MARSKLSTFVTAGVTRKAVHSRAFQKQILDAYTFGAFINEEGTICLRLTADEIHDHVKFQVEKSLSPGALSPGALALSLLKALALFSFFHFSFII